MAGEKNLGEVVGDSAYEIAVKNGFEGTEEQWLEYLKASYDDTELINLVNTKQEKPKQVQSSETAPNLNLKNNEEYTFTSPLNSLTINTQEGIGSIYFVTNSNFSVTLPEAILWDGGTVPEWKPFSIYVIVYFNGIVIASQGA